jgi:ribonuclease-3
LEDGSHINNERLEFLGDAVIESVTSDYLFIEFPDSDEGFLTQVRSKMVSRQSLNRIASILGLDKHVISNAAGNSTQKHIYGDAFEAMMGAIYLDQGYDFVNRLLINEIFAKHLSIDEVLKSETDFKSRLIEWCQKNRYTIEFRTDTDRSASSARPLFHSVVYVDGIAIGHGHGDSKKAAEQNAAYSVSQTQNTSIDDEHSARILDQLDRMSS